MIKYFLPDGREVSLAGIQSAAQQSNLTVEEYIQKAGITTSQGDEQVQPQSEISEPDMSKLSDIEYIKANKDRMTSFGKEGPSEEYFKYLEENPELAKRTRRTMTNNPEYDGELNALQSLVLRAVQVVPELTKKAAALRTQLTSIPVSIMYPGLSNKEQYEIAKNFRAPGVGMISSGDISDASEKVIDFLESYQMKTEDESVAKAFEKGNYGEAGYLTARGMIDSSPSIAASMYGLPGIAVHSALIMGDKFEQEIEKEPDADIATIHANAFGSGLIQGVSDYAFFKFLKGAGLIGKTGGATAAKEYLETGIKTYIKPIIGAKLVEGSTEVVQDVAQKMLDKASFGRNIYEGDFLSSDFKYELIDNFVIGALMGGTVTAATKLNQSKPESRAYAEGLLMPEVMKDEVNTLTEEYRDITQKIQNEENPQAKKALEVGLIKIEDKISFLRSKYKTGLYAMDSQQTKQYAKNKDEVLKLKTQIEKSTTEEGANALLDQITDLEQENQLILNAAYDSKFQRVGKATDKAYESLGINKTTLTADEIADLNIDEANILAQTAEGIIYDDAGGTTNVVLNKDVLKDTKAVNVAAHELLHGLLSSGLKANPEAAVNLKNSLLDYLVELDSDKLLDSDISRRLKAYTGKPEEAQAEEVLTLFADATANGDIIYEDNVFTKAGDGIRRFLQNAGIIDIKFDTGKDVFNFIKDYNADIAKGGVRKVLINKAKKGFTGKLVEGDNKNLKKEFENKTKASQSIYDELQAIEEFESNFIITPESRARREELQKQLKDKKLQPLYDELQQIEEFESNFNITPESRARREELQQELKNNTRYTTKASKSVLEEINNLVPNTVKTKQDFQSPKVFNPIYESLTQRDKVINNYIRSRSESQEEANKIIDNVTERLVKFDPEQTRADGTKVGIGGFGEFIFANTRFGKLDARKDLFKESEKVKVQDRIDKPEAKQVKAEETVEEKRQVNLELPDAIIKTADRTAEVGVLASSKAVKALPKTATIKDKARAVRKASDELIKNQIQKDLKNDLLKVTKDKNKFKSFIDKNWESVGNAYLNNTNIEQLKKPSQQDTRETLENWIDNGFTKDDVYNFFTDPSLKPSTRSDRKNVALIRALVSEVANDARVKIIEKNPELAEEFKKENKVSLASISILDGKGKPIPTTFEKFLPGYDINSTRPAQKVADDLFKNQGGKIKFNNEKDINRMFDMLEKALDMGKKDPNLKIPVLFLERSVLRPGPRAIRVDGSQEAKVKGLLQNKKINQAVVKEIEENGNPKQQQYVKNVLLLEDRYNKLLKRKDDFAEFTGPAKDFKLSQDYNKVFGKTEKEIQKNWDKKDKFNAINSAMFEQTWRPIINLLNVDPSLAPAFERLSQTGEGTANWVRLGAPVSFYSINPRGALDGKKFVLYRWEHAMQANNVRFVLLKAGMDGVKFNDIFYPVVKNYEIGALDNFYDKIITKGKLGNSMGPGWDFINGIWPQRYANKIIYGLGGIPMNSLTNGTFTIGQLYNINERGGNVKASKSVLSDEFNTILEENKGVSKDAVYSNARAAKLGKKNNPYKFFVPYSGEDYVGLIYPTLGKGKKGEQDLEWYKKNLIDPYAVGISNFEAEKQNALNTWTIVKSKVKGAKKLLNKEGIRDFSNEEAIRLYLWDKQGILPDGVAKKDLKAVVNYVKDNEELLNFANEIESITEGKYADPGSDWLAGSITTDLIEYIDGVKRKEFLRPWKEAVNDIYSKDNLNKLRAIYGDKYVEALQDVLYRMDTGSNRPTGQNKLANEWLNWVNNSVGGIMFFNSRSALLQTISSVNYINWSDNNPLRIAEAFGNQPQFWKDFSFLFNSDFLKQRRGGLQTDVNADEIAKRASQAKNKMKAGIAYLLKKGFIPTQYADSFAISFGGATFYRNRIKSLMKDGMEQKQAEEQAYLDWKEISEEAQQSSRPDRVSMQQASPLGRVILAFGNTPIQYARIIKKASSDLVNGRGDWKTNLSKIMWYGAAQNVIFTALQNALFAILFSDDDDEEQNIKERGKYVRSANSIVDTLLRGAGLHGAVFSAGKNIILKLIEETYGKELGLKESNKGDLEKAALEITSISPPINSKIKKFMSAFRAFEYKQEREKMKELGFSIDNPALMSGGRLLSVGFNIPADRLIQKMQNLKYATQKENEFWQSIGLAMGYTYWDLMMDDPVKKIMKEKKRQKLRKSLGLDNTKVEELDANLEEVKKALGLYNSPIKKIENLPNGVLGKAHKDGTIQIRKGLSKEKRKKVIAHEKKHIRDMRAGKLNYDKNFVYWMGCKYPRTADQKIIYNGKALPNGHKSFPWEKSANKAI